MNELFLIADSGATKTHWVLMDGTKIVKEHFTIGFNPYFVDSNAIIEELSIKLLPVINANIVKNIYFYGSGCSNTENCNILNNALSNLFTFAEIIIEHDLLGAARGALINKKGIACILGTGSNSCYYDGSQIIDNIPSLGYILADEGSGAYIGKRIIRDYFFEDMPGNISKKFKAVYNIDLVSVLDSVYNRNFPNRYLASFTKFLSDHRDHDYVKNLVINCFDEFFKNQVARYNNYMNETICAIGSIAFHFSDFLRIAAKSNGLEISSIKSSPIDGLIKFHTIRS